MSFFTGRIARFSSRQIIAVAMIFAIAALLVPLPVAAAALRTADRSVRQANHRVSAWLASEVATLISGTTQGDRRERKGVRPAPPLTQEERATKVARLELNVAGEIELKSRQPMLISAIPVDAEGNAIQGLIATWQSSDKNVVFVRKTGEVLAGKVGTATLIATAGTKHVTVPVRVVEGSKEPFGGKKRVDSKRSSQGEVGASTRNTNNLVARNKKRQERAHATITTSSVATMLPFMRDPNDDPLPDNETSSLYQTNNLVGTPPGKKKPGALSAASAVPVTESGTKNFSFGLPVAGLPGRGVSVSLNLVYNSLLWNKSTNPSTGATWMTYDVDSGFPAQGFRLGYGQIEDQGSAGFTLTDSNGTRHALAYSSWSHYDTTDGTFIHFNGGSGWGTLFYPDGTQVGYGAAGGGYRSYPTSVMDRNGNYILISYLNGVGPRISTIQDTLGRYVRFYYDSNNELVTITMPGLTGQSDLQVMRFYYETLSLPSGLFASGINVNKPSTARVIRYIYLPASAEGSSSSSGDIGYRFDYSEYGMIYQVVKFHGMTASTTSSSTTGTVTEGTNTTAATTTYDYNTSASALSDVPTFSHRTDEWAGRTSGGSAPYYTFSTSEQTSETITTVTAPGGATIMETHTIKNPGVWNDGLITETRIQNASSVVFRKTVRAWEQNSSNGTPRVASVRLTNESGKTIAKVFSYDDTHTPYNNVSVVSERDFTTNDSVSSTELRRTETTYVTSSNYLNRRLLNLPSMVKTFPGGSSTPASRIDYIYDDYGSSHANLTARNVITMHSASFDPFQEYQEIYEWECVEWGYDEGGFWDCLNYDWVSHLYNPYDSATDYRGNITSVITYPDATTTTGAITHSTTFDIAGNVMTAQVDCCQTQSFTYSSANNDYAYPVSLTKGNPSGLNLTTSLSYDMNTGLVATTTDPNSQVTYFSYNSDSLRLDHVDFPDGGEISYDYFNALSADSASRYHYGAVTSTKLDSSRYVASKSYFDGRGLQTQTFDSYTTGDGWAVTDVEYDSMGRPYRRSNPHYCTSDYGTCSINPSGIWTTVTRDQLGRVTELTTPRGDDADPGATTTMQTIYEGEVTTFTDQAGKQKRQIRDALGRSIRIDEPNSSGSLGTVASPNQPTSYTFDVLNNLLKITQDSQQRYFKYDSLSRLIREKQVEQTPNSAYNLSDSVNSSGTWTRKLAYNSYGLLTDAYDARGVQTHFTYDDLNRVTAIDYSDSTPVVHYYYDSQNLPSGAPTYNRGYANGRLIAMTYGSSTSTNGTYFGYNNRGRVNEQRQVTDGNTYSLSYGYNLAGLLVTETYPTGRVLTHSYDNAGRLSQVSDGTTTFASSFSYAPSGGLLSETWGNGAVHSLAYNSALQVSQIKLKQSSTGAELQRYDYLFGEVTQSNGNVDKSKNTGQIGRIDGVINGSSVKEWEERLSYDSLGRLSIASEYSQGTGTTPTWKQEFTFDRYGNRFQSGSANTNNIPYTTVLSTDITDSTNRFVTSGSTPTSYDAAGNITQDAKFRYMNYTYDANGRQINASAMDSDLSQTSAYDGGGRRVQTTSFSVTKTMVYDIFNQQVATYVGTSLENENIYRSGELIAVYEASSTCYMTLADFVTAFYQGALHRNPTSSELIEKTSILSYAQGQSRAKLIKAAQDLGTTLFTSVEYTNTDNETYVTDLYAAYLQRTPDSGGLTSWMNALSGGASFATVRNGFAYSLEFQGHVAQLCPGTSSASTSANLKYVLNDLQGSARALMNNSGAGTSTIVSRHDYLPFGEEIWAGIGLRSSAQGYGTTDKSTRRFAITERDETTGSDNTWFRKYDDFAGRWTSPDPLSGTISDPQSFNRYAYASNDPINLIDPTGLLWDLPDASTGWKDVANGFWGWGYLGGNGWGQDPNPGRVQINISNNAIDQWRNNVWYGNGSDPWVYITATLCFGGVCWSAGEAVYIFDSFDAEFPILGARDSWPPDNPYGYDPKTGLRPTQPAPELEQFPRRLGIGPRGVELRPEFDPDATPSNASRGSGLARGAINFIGRMLGGISSVLGIIGGTLIDVFGPLVDPYNMVHRSVCQQNPNNPGCGIPGD